MAKPTRLNREMIDEYRSKGYWDDAGISDILRRNADRYPDREGVIDSEKRLTWYGLNKTVNAVAIGLMKTGIKRDQALVAQVSTPSASLILHLACQKAGILCCFSPMTFRHNEIRHALKTLNAVAVMTPLRHRGTNYYRMVREIASDLPQLKYFLVTGDEIPEGALSFKDMIETSIETEDPEEYFKEYSFGPFEVSHVVLSSGTTGMPKCIEHTGACSKAGGRGVIQMAKLTNEDVVGIIAPLSGGPGLQNWWAAFQLGAKICMLDRFTPEGALELIEREAITYLAAVPTQLIRILKEADLSRHDTSSLRIVRTGAAAFDTTLARETEEKMRCTVLIASGAQETYSFAQSGIDDPREKRLTTSGKPFPGNEVKIVDDQGKTVSAGQVGQLFVRGATTSSGYYGDLDATLEAWGQLGMDGWYGTGDLAKLDDQGYLILVGREKEMIIRGGQNIYPGEIEDLLLSHDRVTQAIVIGIPDDVMGERACACVTLVPERDFAFEEMIALLTKKGLAVHKLPERLEVLEHFPQLVDGQKVDKITLKKMIVEKIAAEGKVPSTPPFEKGGRGGFLGSS